MAFEIYLWMYVYSVCLSLLLLALFYGLTMRVVMREHDYFILEHHPYAEYTVRQRLFCILSRGRALSRIVLAVALFGLYQAAQFLGRDVEIGLQLYALLLSQ